MEANKRVEMNRQALESIGNVDSTVFEDRNKTWFDVNYDTIDLKKRNFQLDIQKQEEP